MPPSVTALIHHHLPSCPSQPWSMGRRMGQWSLRVAFGIGVGVVLPLGLLSTPWDAGQWFWVSMVILLSAIDTYACAMIDQDRSKVRQAHALALVEWEGYLKMLTPHQVRALLHDEHSSSCALTRDVLHSWLQQHHPDQTSS